VKIEAKQPPLAAESDSELIDGCLKGNSQAWESFIRRYQNLIYSVPIRYHFSMQDAADVFQTVCVILLQKLKTLRSMNSLSSWIYITTKRECWKFAKKRESEVPLENNPSFQVEANEEQLVLQFEVKRVLEQLPEKCRKLLTSLYYSNPPLSYEEITETMNIPFGSIGPTRARCLEQLRKRMI
jgi:RNA polymerase sigma factor (sigma-70 family)